MSDDVTGGTLRDEFRRQSGHSLIRMVFQYWSFVHRASREFVLRTARLALQLPPSCSAVRCCSPASVLSSFHAVKCDQPWSGRDDLAWAGDVACLRAESGEAAWGGSGW